MEQLNWLANLADLGLSAVLLVILWQGLQRFDKLLAVVIHLALLNSDDPITAQNAREQLTKISEKD